MSTEIQASQVAEWLKANPEFFDSHPDVLISIEVPHASGSAVSLVERQVSVLRDRNLEMRERLDNLIALARENDILFEKMRGLILALMEARSIPDMAAALERELKTRFQSEFIGFLLFDVEGATGAACNVRLVEAQEHVPSLVKGRQAIAGQLREEELRFLFGHEGEQVKSCAVIPLQFERPLGLLAIGASNREHFRTSMDTLFISFVGDVLSRLLQPLLSGNPTRHIA